MKVLYDFVYPDAKKYKGKARHLVFAVDVKAPVTPVEYLKKHITNAVQGLRDKGYEPLRIVVFEDKPKNRYIYHVWYYRKYGRFVIPLIPLAIALAFTGGAVTTYLVSQSMKPKDEEWNWDPSQATANPNTLAISPWVLAGIAGVLIGAGYLIRQLKH